MGTAPGTNGSKRQKAVQWVAYLISILCLLWVYHNFDWQREFARLRAVHWRWIVLAVFCDFLVYVIQSWRWNALLRPIKRLSLWRTLQSIYIGLFANEALPLKSGEIIRCYLVAHWNHIPFPTVLSSWSIERFMDGLILITGFVCIMRLSDVPRDIEVGAGIVFAIVIVIGVTVLMAAFSRRFARHISTHHRWSELLVIMVEGLRIMARSRWFFLAFLGSVAYLGLQLAPVYALLAGYGLNLPWTAALVVLIVTRLGTIVPGPPSNVGVFHFFAYLALHQILHVEAQTAKSVAGLMFAVITIPLLAGGSLALGLTGSDIREIYETARSHRKHFGHHPDPAPGVR
jgi:uncharacterized protein (TIRG00374 family)